MTQPRYPVLPKLCRSKRKHRYSARLREDGRALSTKSSCKVSILNLLKIFQILICRLCSFEDFRKRLEKGWGLRSNSLRCLNPLSCSEVLHPNLEEAKGWLCCISKPDRRLMQHEQRTRALPLNYCQIWGRSQRWRKRWGRWWYRLHAPNQEISYPSISIIWNRPPEEPLWAAKQYEPHAVELSRIRKV